MTRRISRRAKLNAIALASYGVVSVACLRAANYPVLKSLIERFWSWIWLLGPPVALLHGTGYWWVYATGSILVVSLMIAGERAWAPWPGVTLVCVGLAIAVWCISGIL